MAATCRGLRSGKDITLTLEDGRITLGRRLTYVVVADAIDEPELNILLSGCPIIGITVDEFGNVCRGVHPKQDPKQPRVWLVDCDFGGQPTQEEDPEEEENTPLTWRSVWKGKPSWVERFSANDANGKPVVNAAGDRFSEPIGHLEPIVTHPFTQYEDPALTIPQIVVRHNSMNNATFRGFQKWTLRLLVTDFEKLELLGTYCWKIDYEAQWMEGDPANKWYKFVSSAWALQTTLTSGWHEMRLNVGSHYLDGSGNKLMYPDKQGRAVSNGRLAADGTKLTSGDPLVFGIPRCKELDFSFIRSA